MELSLNEKTRINYKSEFRSECQYLIRNIENCINVILEQKMRSTFYVLFFIADDIERLLWPCTISPTANILLQLRIKYMIKYTAYCAEKQ